MVLLELISPVVKKYFCRLVFTRLDLFQAITFVRIGKLLIFFFFKKGREKGRKRKFKKMKIKR